VKIKVLVFFFFSAEGFKMIRNDALLKIASDCIKQIPNKGPIFFGIVMLVVLSLSFAKAPLLRSKLTTITKNLLSFGRLTILRHQVFLAALFRRMRESERVRPWSLTAALMP